ncbi:MAG: cytochrome P450 [Acidimicrobiales bacterium]|jgi:cytochrome P450|nr:cytochrome P450 [Acidimicrobiales bacterium]
MKQENDINSEMGKLVEASWNPFDPDFLINPYPQYELLRDQDPVHRTAFGNLVVTRFDDVFEVLRNPNTSVDRNNTAEGMDRPEHIKKLQDASMDRPPSILMLDPPEHTRLRKLVQRTFTPRGIEKMRHLTTEIVEDLLDQLAEKREIDLIKDFSFVVPFVVIHSMLGLPDADMLDVREWSQTLVQTLEPNISPEQVDAAIWGGTQLNEYLTEALAWKRNQPGDDLLSDLIAVEEGGEGLTEPELLSMISLLFVAGHETTVNLIGNGTHSLLNNPEQFNLVLNDSSVDSTIADELLRFDSPVQNSGRLLLEDMELSGVHVEAGELVLTALGSANRDPRFWGDSAHVLDVKRQDASRHVSFGSGVHYCLGAALAKMEGEIAVTKLIRRFPEISITSEPTYNSRIILRGREEFPVDLGSPK